MPSDTEIAPSGLPPQDTKGKLWADTYNSVLYPVWMEELVSGWLLSVWSRINFGGSLVVAVTSTGSATAVWLQKFDAIWKGIALVAAFSSIFLTVATVAQRVKDQGKFYSQFKELRLRVVAFRLDINTMELSEGRKKFRELRDEGNKLISDAPPDIALTKGRKLKIQEELDSILKREGYLL